MIPRVVAVVCTYWPNREGNTVRILSDLRNGTRVPDHILVLNNNRNRDVTYLQGPLVSVINSGFNSTCRGKFVAALLDVADYYLLLDDDTSVGTETLAKLMEYAHPDICTGYLGCYIKGEGDTATVNDPAGRLWPHDAEQVTPCDTFCGCAMFCSFKALVNMLRLETLVRLGGKWPHQGDDILLGLANRSTVVPLRGAERFVDLGYQGQAMCYSDENYYNMRDDFLRDVLANKSGFYPE